MEAFGPPDVMELREDIAVPKIGTDDVLVRVQAIAVARTKDVAMRAGHPPFASRVTMPHTPGTECAGTVEAVGSSVDNSLIGTRVAVSAVLVCSTCVACTRGHEEACSSFALVGVDRQGCYAQFVAAPAVNVHAVPDDLPIAHAAALAANGPVARAQLDAGGVGPGSVVAVMGAAGALGSTAACLARYRGATVIAVDHLDNKGDLLAQLPLDAAFEGDDPQLAEALRAHTNGWGVDCVIDNLGLASLWDSYRPALARMGRIVVSGAISRVPVAIELLPFYLHSQSLIGVRTGNRTQTRELWTDVREGFRLPDAAVVVREWTDMRTVHGMVEAGRSTAQTVMAVE